MKIPPIRLQTRRRAVCPFLGCFPSRALADTDMTHRHASPAPFGSAGRLHTSEAVRVHLPLSGQVRSTASFGALHKHRRWANLENFCKSYTRYWMSVSRLIRLFKLLIATRKSNVCRNDDSSLRFYPPFRHPVRQTLCTSLYKSILIEVGRDDFRFCKHGCRV